MTSLPSTTSTLNPILLDRTLGTVYGVALGDAMGMPGELWSRKHIQDHFGRIDRFLDGPDGHFVVDGFVAGQVTDDTQQMMMLAESMLSTGGTVDVVTLARDLVAWADRVGASEGHFLGPTSARVITALRNGADPMATGVAGTTNGAAMRIAPIGIVGVRGGDRDALVDQVEASCRIAHGTNIAIAGAAMVASYIDSAIASAITSDAGVDQTVETAARAALDAGYRGMRRGEDAAGASLTARAEWGITLAGMGIDDDAFLENIYNIVGSGTETTESVPAAIALAVRAKADPHRCALLAANLGGDTDTIGAMAVGMAGAVGGFSSIDADLVITLDRVNGLPFADIATRLATLRQSFTE